MHLHNFNDHVVWFSPDKFHPLDEVWSSAKPKQAKDKKTDGNCWAAVTVTEPDLFYVQL